MKKIKKSDDGSESDASGSDDELSGSSLDEEELVESEVEQPTSGATRDENDEDDDEEIWKEHESLTKKEALLDSEPTNHHEVHCPYYPRVKYEWWYMYLVERKSRRLVSMVVPCKTLDTEKTVIKSSFFKLILFYLIIGGT